MRRFLSRITVAVMATATLTGGVAAASPAPRAAEAAQDGEYCTEQWSWYGKGEKTFTDVQPCLLIAGGGAVMRVHSYRNTYFNGFGWSNASSEDPASWSAYGTLTGPDGEERSWNADTYRQTSRTGSQDANERWSNLPCGQYQSTMTFHQIGPHHRVGYQIDPGLVTSKEMTFVAC